MTNYVLDLELSNEFISSHTRKRIYKLLKRSSDFLFGLIGFLVLIPTTIIVKILYMLTGDFDKVIFVQERIGLNGKTFRLYKYRTMVPNADKILMKILKKKKKLAKEYKKNKKLKNDPRITKIGKFLRKASIDELPQMINILKGDMSLIGNRPYLPREREDMGVYYEAIIETKPGLTGYWQVGGRSDTTFETRLKMEKYYSEHAGFRIDIKIFLKTFKVVLGRHGAE